MYPSFIPPSPVPSSMLLSSRYATICNPSRSVERNYLYHYNFQIGIKHCHPLGNVPLGPSNADRLRSSVERVKRLVLGFVTTSSTDIGCHRLIGRPRLFNLDVDSDVALGFKLSALTVCPDVREETHPIRIRCKCCIRVNIQNASLDDDPQFSPPFYGVIVCTALPDFSQGISREYDLF